MTTNQRVVKVSNEATFWEGFTDLFIKVLLSPSVTIATIMRTVIRLFHQGFIVERFKKYHLKIMGNWMSQGWLIWLLGSRRCRNEIRRTGGFSKACSRGTKRMGGTWQKSMTTLANSTRLFNEDTYIYYRNEETLEIYKTNYEMSEWIRDFS